MFSLTLSHYIGTVVRVMSDGIGVDLSKHIFSTGLFMLWAIAMGPRARNTRRRKREQSVIDKNIVRNKIRLESVHTFKLFMMAPLMICIYIKYGICLFVCHLFICPIVHYYFGQMLVTP